MNEIQVFKYNQKDITMKLDDKGEPWFVASEICELLDLDNVSMAIDRLDEDEKGLNTIDTLGGPQKKICVNESGLYTLIMTSRKEEARSFRRWVTGEVLPSIRKTGQYGVAAMTIEEHLMLSSKALYEQSIKIKAIETKVDTLEIKLTKEVADIQQRLTTEKINQFPTACAMLDWISRQHFVGMSPAKVSEWLHIIKHPIEAYRYTTDHKTVATVPAFKKEGLTEACQKLMQESELIKETTKNRIYNHAELGRFYVKSMSNQGNLF